MFAPIPSGGPSAEAKGLPIALESVSISSNILYANDYIAKNRVHCHTNPAMVSAFVYTTQPPRESVEVTHQSQSLGVVRFSGRKADSRLTLSINPRSSTISKTPRPVR